MFGFSFKKLITPSIENKITKKLRFEDEYVPQIKNKKGK